MKDQSAIAHLNANNKQKINYTLKKSQGFKILTFSKNTMKFFEEHPCKPAVSYIFPILKYKLNKLSIEVKLSFDQTEFFESILNSTSDFSNKCSFTELQLKNIVVEGTMRSTLTIDECLDVLVHFWEKFAKIQENKD